MITAPLKPNQGTLTVRVPLSIRRRGGRRVVVTPDGTKPASRRVRIDNLMIKALARAFRWQHMLETGKFATLSEIAVAEGVNPSYLSRVIRLTLLAPDIVEALLDGRGDHNLDVRRLLTPLPVCWSEQRAYLLEH